MALRASIAQHPAPEEIDGDQSKLVEVHEKYLVDKGDQKVYDSGMTIPKQTHLSLRDAS